MSSLDWVVLILTLSSIVIYGTWKTKGSKSMESYILADREMKWGTVCITIMATQASAITFLSTPGQAFEDGMGFIQFYFGLPIAMIILSVTAVPLYNRLKVLTAYEYLESRFDMKTRVLAALLFLIQRGLSTGITIYAPSLVLSTILGWNLTLTNIVIGGLVIIYTVTGGTKAVSITQTFQMFVILTGMFIAGYMVIRQLPPSIHFTDAVNIAGHMGKMNLIKFSFDWNDRYNFWSGLIGGLFLAMSYFGTDQSQVARYLQGNSIKESRLGLLFNGLLKIPMQFLILLLGVLVYVFYLFNPAPIFFNKVAVDKVATSSLKNQYMILQDRHDIINIKKQNEVILLSDAIKLGETGAIQNKVSTIKSLNDNQKEIKSEFKEMLSKVDVDLKVKDTDYVFITFILNYLPQGLIGLLIAVIMCAAMSSTASGLNSLGATTSVDIYKRMLVKDASQAQYLFYSKLFTVIWGIVAILFSIIVSMFENLIEAVNILGSLFYGTILGIFLAAFYIKKIKSRSVFIAALISEVLLFALFLFSSIGYLWYNVIGCLLVIGMALIIEFFFAEKIKPQPDKK